MKKEVLKSTRVRRRTAKQRALLTFLDGLGRANPRRDQALWASFDRDLKAARLTFRATENG
jgi:hypothetical protein